VKPDAAEGAPHRASDITRLLNRWTDGDSAAFQDLIPLVYDALRTLADHYMRHERPDHTLQPTALVHEAYLRLNRHGSGFNSRVHFYGAAAQVMRRILVDHAREHRAGKRGGAADHVTLDEQMAAAVGGVPIDVLALDEALDRLGRISPVKVQVVELRYFGGLSIDETATFLGISPATVKRHWSFARAWLYRALNTG
jgi:RNA polymerase sigma factor (TIGR02999 family)